MHLLVHAFVAGTNVLTVAGHVTPVHMVVAAAHTTDDDPLGRFAVVGDLLAAGALLIACGVYGLRRSR